MPVDRNEQGEPAEYLGDAVYAVFRNGMIGLQLDDHRSEVLIWMESDVLDALIRFNKSARSVPPPYHSKTDRGLHV